MVGISVALHARQVSMYSVAVPFFFNTCGSVKDSGSHSAVINLVRACFLALLLCLWCVDYLCMHAYIECANVIYICAYIYADIHTCIHISTYTHTHIYIYMRNVDFLILTTYLSYVIVYVHISSKILTFGCVNVMFIYIYMFQ
jgi:hypothetical protein